jgi:hypothetical protein
MPLMLLRNNIKNRYNALKIECVKWNNTRLYEQAFIVLITLEFAISESFGHFIKLITGHKPVEPNRDERMPCGIGFRSRERVTIAHVGIARVGTSRDAIGLFNGDIAAGGRNGIRNVGGIAI